jgi:hypothetical protein
MSAEYQEIEFTIKKDGSVDYTVRGIKGSGCDALSRVFEEMGQVSESRKTGEYYEKEPETKVLTQRK